MVALDQKTKVVVIFLLLFVVTAVLPLNLPNMISNFSKADETDNQTKDQFPFVGQRTTYNIVQKAAGIVGSSGTLEVYYDAMYDESTIHGNLHVLVTSLLEFYDEYADGYENLETRHLTLDASGTYIIYLFMVYFFAWSGLTPTPLWVFPSDLVIGSEAQFWNYTAICEKSQSIAILDKYYEVFVFRANGSLLDLTLMYGFGRHGNSDWYGLLFYLSASFYEASINDYLIATVTISETNVELSPLRELNRKAITSLSITFYSVVAISAIVFRFKKRRDLVGGEV